jgi:hypothetical protein
MGWIFLIILVLAIALPLTLLVRGITRDLEVQRNIDFDSKEPSLEERKREAYSKIQDTNRSQKQKERACFWTRPIGHIMVGPSYGQYCQFCGKKKFW